MTEPTYQQNVIRAADIFSPQKQNPVRAYQKDPGSFQKAFSAIKDFAKDVFGPDPSGHIMGIKDLKNPVWNVGPKGVFVPKSVMGSRSTPGGLTVISALTRVAVLGPPLLSSPKMKTYFPLRFPFPFPCPFLYRFLVSVAAERL
jgi:hypothetical protein